MNIKPTEDSQMPPNANMKLRVFNWTIYPVWDQEGWWLTDRRGYKHRQFLAINKARMVFGHGSGDTYTCIIGPLRIAFVKVTRKALYDTTSKPQDKVPAGWRNIAVGQEIWSIKDRGERYTFESYIADDPDYIAFVSNKRMGRVAIVDITDFMLTAEELYKWQATHEST